MNALHSQLGARSRKLPWLPIALLSAVIVIMAGLAVTPAAVKIEEASGLDWLFAWRGPRAAPEDVVVIALSTHAAEALSLPLPSLWPRTVYAELLNKLSAADTHAVVFDIAFRSARSADEDTPLADAIGNLGNVVLFKYLKRRQISLPGGTIDIEEEITPPELFSSRVAAVGTFTLPKYADQIYRTHLFHELATGIQPTQPVLALVMRFRDEAMDLCRQLPSCVLPTPDEETTVQALAVALYSSISGRDAQYVDRDEITMTKRLLVNAFRFGRHYVHINYYGGNGAITTIGVDRIFDASPDDIRRWLDDKAVFIGYADDSSTEQRDSHITTFSKRSGVHLSGVEISATVLANLIDGSSIKRPDQRVWLLAIMASVALGMCSFGSHFRTAMVLQAVVGGGYAFGVYALFSRSSVWLPLALPLAALLLTNLLALITKYHLGRKREQIITRALQQYLPTTAARELATSLVGYESRHQLVYGVCMMSDIVGYSRLSESCDPAELHELMNRYYAILVEEVGKQDGMVANIVGDSLLAIWVDSEITTDHCDRACLAALNIRARLDSLKEFCARVPTCFAIHGGAFSLGNLGAAGHFEYSPVGDIINTTARIEKLNRTLGTHTLISRDIEQKLSAHLREQLVVTRLGQYEMRNRSTAEELFTISRNVETE